MRFSMTLLASGNIWMLTAMTEGTGECLVLSLCFLHQFANFTVTRNTESSWCSLDSIDFQRVMGRMASQAIGG